MSWLSALGGAASSLLAKGSGLPNLPGYGLGSKDPSFDGHSIWTLHDGIKRDDNSNISIFIYDTNQTPNSFIGSKDKKLILGFAKNALKKLKTLRHPDILKFHDGSETDTAVYIVTEKVTGLSSRLETLKGLGKKPTASDVEWKMWGLSRIVSALKFLNGPGTSTHGNLRPSSIFITQSGEWKLSGFEVLSSPKDSQPMLYSLGGLLPDSSRYASPETQKTGYDALKDLDPSCLDSYQLYLLIQTLFNDVMPSQGLAQQRGSIPPALFSVSRRLASPSPTSRLKAEALWEIGFGAGESGGGGAGGFFRENRLIKICEGLEGFSLASQGERAALVRSIKESAESLPPEFLKFRVLPSLVQSFDHSADGPTLLPLAISISSSLSPTEFSSILLQPLVKLFASPDRAIRLSLLDHMPQYVDQLDKSVVVEKIWPNLLTGFTDTVPLIREATVKSILLLAPKLSDRILNNDLLRHLAKTQIDVEPGIRTNTCILLGRLSKSLSLATCRKVLIPAFTRSLRDPFTPARIAGLMALMATVDYYENEDLAGKVIPGMGICLLDKEKTVRDQAFRALDMFVERVRKAAAEMPETIATSPLASDLSPGNASATASQPGLAMSAAGAAGALAGWAFSSASKKLTMSDLSTSIANKDASQELQRSQTSLSDPFQSRLNPSAMTRSDSTTLVKAFTLGSTATTPADEHKAPIPSAIWGDGDLMDVEADVDDWSTFETGPPVHEPSFVPLPSKIGQNMKTAKAPRNGATNNQLKLTRSLNRPKLTNAASLVAALEADQELDDGADDSWGVESFGAADNSIAPSRSSITLVGRQLNLASGVPRKALAQEKPSASTEDEWGQFDDNGSTNTSDKQSAAKVVNSKDDKAAQMAKMREERRAKMAALKAKKTTVA
ncbi:hypothetical protein CROQUDRAFT_85801 [Cronartium quercuum f. sp. fusiforme G11]|uniref:Protein kinase domain-containing protein n=1 Tax=Cronartium quercuum f. sp. fusiforme G11 TaxID=708437 RepID=A0A9P6NXD7_9BASI|nr:hypothetical protein CROQUDRAFT_85801 [Cronartium quercuum f. sp. fusiforme G11]